MTPLHVGASVTYGDATATVSGGKTALVTGTINGPPLEHPDGTRYWPVWSERDGGREPTTVYVSEGNIVDCRP